MWNKIKLIDYFQKNINNNTIIKESSGSLILKGNIDEINEIDLCNHTLFEVKISQKNFMNEVRITLHNKFLGIQLKVFNEESKTFKEKNRILILYKNLEVKIL